MPNWVNNRLIVSGDKKQVAAFFEKHIVNGEFDFDTIIPEPRKIEDCPKDCIANENSHIVADKDRPWFDWYHWHLTHWGCKWNASYTNYDKDSDTVCFDTPWSTPDPVIQAMSLMWPDLTFHWTFIEEQGTYYTGDMTIENGEVIEGGVADSDSITAYKIMFDMWGNEDDYIYDNTTCSFVYIDDDLRDEYDKFVEDWKADGDRECMDPPCFKEWYLVDRKETK